VFRYFRLFRSFSSSSPKEIKMKSRLLHSFIICLTLTALAWPQSQSHIAISGRWNLTLENADWRIETPADLRVEYSGRARLVLLGPTDGAEGLYLGQLTGQQLSLTGQGLHGETALTLQAGGDLISGQLIEAGVRTEVRGRRAPPIQPEVSVKDYAMLGEAVWNGVNLHFYQLRPDGVDWNAVRDRSLPEIRAARDDGAVTVAIRRMLSQLQVSRVDFYLAGDGEGRFRKNSRVEWQSLSNETGYLALRDFSSEDLMSYDRELDRAMDEASKRPGLIVDLRHNRGDNLEAALAALNFILPEGRPVAYVANREALARLKVASIDQLDPASLPASFVDNQITLSKFQGAGMYLAGGKYKRPYRGKMAVLIDETCSGSCEIFAAALKEAGVATLIGRRTHGSVSFSSLVTFTFGNKMFSMARTEVKGWRMKLPSMNIRTAKGDRLEGRGVEPDVAVEISNTVDAELARAIEWITNDKRF
jgi:C-terminal processing protease CtpA/Prc